MIDLCGENGLVNQVTDLQKQINEKIALGKNAIGEIQSKIAEAKTLADTLKNDPDAVTRTLQEDILNLISAESLANPLGLVAQIADIRASYQEAGDAVNRIIENVQQFIENPLSTSLDVCKDIPNITKLGDKIVTLANSAKVPSPDASPTNIKEAVEKYLEEKLSLEGTATEEILQIAREQTVPTSPKFPTPDVVQDVVNTGRIPAEIAYNPGPGQAHRAAVAQATMTREQVAAVNRSAPPPPPSIANPFPDNNQYTGADFQPSRFANNIANKLNTLDPSIRALFANGIKDYLANNHKDGRDLNATECFRSRARSAQLAASGIRAAGAGRSWHNYGAACDIAIYVNGQWDQGTRGTSEYTGRLRTSMAKFGLINDLRGDSGHFYVQAFGAGVPRALQNGSQSITQLAAAKGVTTTALA